MAVPKRPEMSLHRFWEALPRSLQAPSRRLLEGKMISEYPPRRG